MAISRNHCCNGKATKGSLCIAESHFIVNNKKYRLLRNNIVMALQQ
jgi:hypothetical protein